MDHSPRAPALLFVPDSASAGPMPLVVMLHGAGGLPQQSMDLVRPFAERFGFMLLAPSSAEVTWDVIARGRYDADALAIDDLLRAVFEQYAVDPRRLAIAGFSDGASYALSLGLMNGDLFTDVIAFSPGFMAPARTQGEPSIHISHGVRDTVLPIEQCSRAIEADLRAAGYSVDYREFPDGHTVPDFIAEAFFSALMARSPS